MTASTAVTPGPEPQPAHQKPYVLWSASSWATWKQCPHKLKLREQRWATPSNKPDSRMAVMAMPGLVIDRLFELWLHRKEFENFDWIKGNFDMIWQMVESKARPKWNHDEERRLMRGQTKRSAVILYNLLHQHDLLNDQMGLQMEFHETIVDGITIAGAIDLWTIRQDGKLVVVDFKNFNSHTKRSIDQLHFYALALKRRLGREPDEAGYVCFHPAYSGYRRVELRACDRNKLLARLVRATEAKRAGRFPAKYSYVTCPRFCEFRFSCEIFCQNIGRTPIPQ